MADGYDDLDLLAAEQRGAQRASSGCFWQMVMLGCAGSLIACSCVVLYIWRSVERAAEHVGREMEASRELDSQREEAERAAESARRESEAAQRAAEEAARRAKVEEARHERIEQLMREAGVSRERAERIYEWEREQKGQGAQGRD